MNEITILYREKKLNPIEYRITKTLNKKSKLIFWYVEYFEYWIECKFSRLGPFNSEQEARFTAALSRSVVLPGCEISTWKENNETSY